MTGLLADIDLAQEGELFLTRTLRPRRLSLGYRRFARAGDAIRYAIEHLSPSELIGTFLEVDGTRFDASGIRRLYLKAGYRLERSPSK
jgi:hypothetical protein